MLPPILFYGEGIKGSPAPNDAKKEWLPPHEHHKGRGNDLG